jgi:phosphosulfolactate synthase
MHSPSIALPTRSTKPRHQGLTVVIDNGLATGAFIDSIASAADYIDYVKFGWGTAMVTPQLDAKIGFLQQRDIAFVFGGTLFEKFVAQGRVDAYFELCHAHGCRAIEISNGTIPLDNAEKAQFIAEAAKEFVVLSEVGYKDADRSQSLAPERWIEFIEQDREAGASYVITEARESGRSGICAPDGSPRFDLVESILEEVPDPSALIFEAPTRALQAFFVTRLGADVNLANISLAQVLATETLRLGLRSDTLLHFELESHHLEGTERA